MTYCSVILLGFVELHTLQTYSITKCLVKKNKLIYLHYGCYDCSNKSDTLLRVNTKNMCSSRHNSRFPPFVWQVQSEQMTYITLYMHNITEFLQKNVRMK